MEYSPYVVREYMDGWQDLENGNWPDATLQRRKLQGGHSPARTEDGGTMLSIARTKADILTGIQSLNSTTRMVICLGVFENQAPVVGKRRDWAEVADDVAMPLWVVGKLYSDSLRTIAYHLGWRPQVGEFTTTFVPVEKSVKPKYEAHIVPVS